MALSTLSGITRWAGTRRNIHPLTPIMIINHPLSASSIFYNPWHPLCSIYVPDSVFPQSLSNFLWSSSPNHCLLFATHAHTIRTCFTVVQKLCHLILVSLNPFLGSLSCSVMPHIHLTILISAHWSATSFSFLASHVSLPFHILLCTQLLYNLPITHTQPFYSPDCPGLPWWAGVRKVKPIWIYWRKR